jgi:hypothetical protein
MDAQNVETHKKVLGIIYVIDAALTILGMLAMRAIIEIVFGFAIEEGDYEAQRAADFVKAITSVLPAILIIFVGLPTLIAGIGLLTKQSWGTVFGLVIGCLHLIWVPIGTAIGIYSIWIYSEDQKLKKAAAAAKL